MGQEDILFLLIGQFIFLFWKKMVKNGDWHIVSHKKVLFSKPLSYISLPGP